MKASEVIAALKSLIKEHGDVKVHLGLGDDATGSFYQRKIASVYPIYSRRGQRVINFEIAEACMAEAQEDGIFND